MNPTEYATARATITAASAAYYTDGSTPLSDAQYDGLLAQVSDYEAAHDVVDPISTQVASGAATGTVPHPVPMLSLDNVYSPQEFADWADPVALYAVEPKMDGSAVAIRFAGGKPVQMLTRGDGTKGEERTFALAGITNLPSGPVPDGWVRGEAIFTRAQFQAANDLRVAAGDAPFSNPRNGCAGTISGFASRSYAIPFSFFAYDTALMDLSADDHCERMMRLEYLGFATARCVAGYTVMSAADAAAAIVDFEAKRGELFVETDGVVVKADAAAYRAVAGSGSRAPRWARAYKFPPQQVTAKLLDVLWQVGRTGRITPRAVITRTWVGGSWVEYATINNPDDIARKGLMMGDTLLLQKAGDVIPEIVESVVADRDGTQTPIVTPVVCPKCGGDVLGGSSSPRCAAGRDCAVVASLAYAVCRDALDVDGLSTSILTRMVAAGLVANVGDLFCVSVDDLAGVPTGKVYADTPTNVKKGIVGDPVPVGDKTATKIVANLDAARSQSFDRVLICLGIHGTGRSMSRKLAAHFGSMSALRAAGAASLMNVEHVGDVKAAQIISELVKLSDVIDAMAAAGVTMEAQVVVPDGDALAGKSVCVTGSMTGALAGMARGDVNALIERHGGRAASSVSKSTSILVAGANAGSKLEKAESLGVSVMDESTFADLLGL